MSVKRFTTLLLIVLIHASFESRAKGDERLIPVVVTGTVKPAVVKAGRVIPLTVKITNGFPGNIGYTTYSLTPNDWNGETVQLTLVNIYRDGKARNLMEESPKINVPPIIAGMSAHDIKPGGSLAVETDASKWKIAGGWRPGKYTADVRIENLSVDGDRCILSVYSEPFEFEVQ